jgi:uncharacterized membrane protein YoaK (UPF0700 family)
LHPVRPLSALQKASIAVMMTWAAGFVDLIGYLTLYAIYTAHMSGDTVAMGRHLAGLQWYGFARRGWTIATFIFGLLVGAFAFDAEKRGVLRVPFPVTLALESSLLLAFIVIAIGNDFRAHIPPQPALKFYVMLALLSTAMGVQNVTIRRVGGLNVYTTFVTGSLVKFGEALSEYLFWVRDRTRHRFCRRIGRVLRLSSRNLQMKRVILSGALWISYLVGAVAGALAISQWKLLSMVVPLAIILALTVYGTVAPFLHVPEEEW